MRIVPKGVFAAVLAVLPVLQGSAVALTGGRTEVVVSADAKAARLSTWFAAEEMTNFLSRALGTTVPIVNAPSSDKTSVVLGTNAWSAAAGIDVAALPRDAAVIVSANDCLYIAGADGGGFRPNRRKPTLNIERGTLNGVYEFLERFVGCRFYFPGELGEVVPRCAQITVPEGRILVSPDYTVRESTANLGDWPSE